MPPKITIDQASVTAIAQALRHILTQDDTVKEKLGVRYLPPRSVVRKRLLDGVVCAALEDKRGAGEEALPVVAYHAEAAVGVVFSRASLAANRRAAISSSSTSVDADSRDGNATREMRAAVPCWMESRMSCAVLREPEMVVKSSSRKRSTP